MNSDYSANGIPDIETNNNEKGCTNCAQKEIAKIYQYVQKISDPTVSKKVKSFVKNPELKRYADACGPEINSGSISAIRFNSLFFTFIVSFTFVFYLL
jgi:hypothetical protein